ncbi:hypothetical protein PoMZ_08120 [Pyricularia oryzae]|uniref:Uncharacterized protein n=1 Tax=Pyricularia oryzae TaxID=318829 RepID=A0A4P7NGT1_PYROR|nr:hypothetical protein PoMZ_08120 [Pyricularia oryzae]
MDIAIGRVPARLLVAIGRRFGAIPTMTSDQNGFEMLDEENEAVSHSCVGLGTIGEAEIECTIDWEKSLWGVLGPEMTPAGLLYMNLSFKKPYKSSVARVTVSITLSEDDLPHGAPAGPLLVTQFHGPSEILGSDLVDEPSGSGPSGKDAERYGHTWGFAGLVRMTYRTIQWTFTRYKPDERDSPSTFPIAFVFEHGGRPFNMRVEIKGKPDRRWLYKHPHSGIMKKSAGVLTVIDPGGMPSPPKSLDGFAADLSKSMYMAYHGRKPPWISKPVAPQFFRQENTLDGRTDSSIVSGSLVAGQITSGAGATQRAISPDIQTVDPQDIFTARMNNKHQNKAWNVEDRKALHDFIEELLRDGRAGLATHHPMKIDYIYSAPSRLSSWPWTRKSQTSRITSADSGKSLDESGVDSLQQEDDLTWHIQKLLLGRLSQGNLPSEKLAVRFIPPRSIRETIFSEIYSLLMADTPDNTFLQRIQTALEAQRDRTFLPGKVLGEIDQPNADPGSVPRPLEEYVDDKPGLDDDDDDDDDRHKEAMKTEPEALQALDATTSFLTTGEPFELYKKDLRDFLEQKRTSEKAVEPECPELARADGVVEAQDMPLLKDEGRYREERLGSVLAAKKLGKRLVNRLAVTYWNLGRMWRPRLADGHRRIEWTCDCGMELFADFSVSQGVDVIDALEQSLQSRGRPPSYAGALNSGATPPVTGQSPTPQQGQQPPRAGLNSTSNVNNAGSPIGQTGALQPTNTTNASTPANGVPPTQATDRPKYLALCVNTGGIYKTLAEINTTRMASDAEVFQNMKAAYVQTRGRLSRFWFLVKPVTVEYIQASFTLWNLRSGYVSVTERPKAIPPSGSIEYEYNPDPLTPMPPMPPEIFIHYLSHEDGASRIRATNDVRHVNEMKQINATACLHRLLPKSIPT